MQHATPAKPRWTDHQPADISELWYEMFPHEDAEVTAFLKYENEEFDAGADGVECLDVPQIAGVAVTLYRSTHYISRAELDTEQHFLVDAFEEREIDRLTSAGCW
jgi:hypothetical protein